MEPINRPQDVQSSEDSVRVIRHGVKYSTNPPPVRSPFDGLRDALRAALGRKQGPLQKCKLRRAKLRRFYRGGRLPGPLPEGLVPAVGKPDVLSLLKSFNSTSLEESITASPGTVLHNTTGSSLRSELSDVEWITIPAILQHKTIDGSSSFFPFSCEKLVEGITESASVQTLQEPGMSSLGAFHDSTACVQATRELELELDQFIAEGRLSYSSSEDPTTSPRAVENNTIDGRNQRTLLQTLQDAHVSSSEELINTASLEELSTASPPVALCNTNPSPFSCEKIVAGLAESARAQALRELDLELDQFLAEECLGDSSSEDPTTSPQAVEHNAIDRRNQRTVLRNTTDSTLSSASSLGSKILSREVPHCFYWYYIRMDRQGSFRIYPDRGGPFQSLQEAEDAIDRYHDGFWCQSWRDVQERAAGGGPDLSTRKVSEVDTYRYLVEALLDQYNEDNNLIGNLAHEFDEDGLMEQWIYEDHSYYYHYNFTTKKKKAGDISLGACTFFAEVSHKLGEDALEVNCCRKMEDEDNGWCYGCKNNGSHGMRHPKNLDAYAGGHEDVLFPCTLEEPSSSDEEEAKETTLWNISKENPYVSGSLFLQQANTVEC